MMQAVAMKTMANLEQIRGAIAAKIDSATFTAWISPLQFDVRDDVLVLTAQNQFSADFIGSVHKNVLAGVAAQFGLKLEIAVRGATAVAAPVANDNALQSYSPAATVAQTVTTDAHAFDSFVCCDENAFVLSACKK